MYRNILIPLDGSERAEAIFAHLGPSLWTDDVTLILLWVVDAGVPPDIFHEGGVAAATLRATEYLEALSARLAAQGVQSRAEIRRGRSADAILEAAAEIGVDLIALSSHGYSGAERLFFGSTAEQVVRSSVTPVLIVKAPHGSDRPAGRSGELALRSDPWCHVLVPLDGSREAEHVLADTVALSASGATVVHLLHSVPHSAETDDDLAVAAGEAYLGRKATDVGAHGLDVETTLRRGPATESILAFLDEQPCDLVAMTTHGRSGWSRWVLGTVAETLLRSIHTPILLRRVASE